MRRFIVDTSVVEFLVLTDTIDILGKMCDRVAIPDEVFNELNQPSTPKAVRQWIDNPPQWVEIWGEAAPTEFDGLRPEGMGDQGERQVLSLALSTPHNAVLLDDSTARGVAEEHGLSFVGTLGILRDACKLDILSYSETEKAINYLASPGCEHHGRPGLYRGVLEETRDYVLSRGQPLGMDETASFQYNYQDEHTGTTTVCRVELHERSMGQSVILVTGLPAGADFTTVYQDVVSELSNRIQNPERGELCIAYVPENKSFSLIEFQISKQEVNSLDATAVGKLSWEEVKALLAPQDIELLPEQQQQPTQQLKPDIGVRR